MCLLNAYANPATNGNPRDIAERAPGLPVTLSCEVLPEIREYERTSTAVINAYVMPVVRSYLRRSRRGSTTPGSGARLLLMQSNGGLSTDAAAVERPWTSSSPVRRGRRGGRARAGARQAAANIIAFDMGGTTAKASIVEGGEVTRAAEYAVGAGISSAAPLTGAGYTLQCRPSICRGRRGRRSLVWIDAGGSLQSARERRRLARPGLLRSRRHRADGDRRTASLGYLNPRIPGRRCAEARAPTRPAPFSSRRSRGPCTCRSSEQRTERIRSPCRT